MVKAPSQFKSGLDSWLDLRVDQTSDWTIQIDG